MDITILGSGTAMPMAERASPSLALFVNSRPVLFDFGPGTLRQLTRAGISHLTVEHIFITHFHPDHTAGLIHFLFATRNPGVLSTRRPLTITGPCGTMALIEGLQSAYNHSLRLPPHVMRVAELAPLRAISATYPGFTLAHAPTVHAQESIAYRVEDERGRSVVYSGDTGFSEELIDLARDTDLLILECSFPDGQEVAGHLTPSAAGRMAALAGAKRLLLTHFYPECLRTDIAAHCRKTYGGQLTLARDLLTIRI